MKNISSCVQKTSQFIPRCAFHVTIHCDKLKGASEFVAYWGAITIDGHSTVPTLFNCDGRPKCVFTWATYNIDFFSSFIKEIRNGKHDKAFNFLDFEHSMQITI